MAFCSNCGKHVEDGVQFCPNCGSAIQNNTNSQDNKSFVNLSKEDHTGEFDPNDIAQNKVLAVLSYLGILVLVPLLGAKDSKFAKFHANQGLIVLIIGVAYGIVLSILSAIFAGIFLTSFHLSGLYYIIKILNLGYLAILALEIFGIVNAATGKAVKLPIVGNFTIVK